MSDVLFVICAEILANAVQYASHERDLVVATGVHPGSRADYFDQP